MRKLKKFRPMLFLLLIVMLQIGTLSPALVTYATTGGPTGTDVTKEATFDVVDLRGDTGDIRSNGSLIGNTDLDKDIRFGLYFSFNFPLERELSENDFLYIPIPDQVTIETGRTQELKDSSGAKIAEATYLDSEKAIKVVFTNEVVDYYGILGDFWFFGGFDESKLGNSNPEVINFSAIGKSFNVNIDQTVTPTPTPTPTVTPTPTPAPNPPTIFKEGVQGTGANWNVTDWKITVDSNNVPITTWSITDQLPSNQELVGTVTIIESVSRDDITNKLGIAVSNNELTIDFSTYDETIDGQYIITFQTKLTDDALTDALTANPNSDKIQMKNKAILNYDDKSPITSNEVNIDIPVKLLKKEKVSNVSGTIDHDQEIEWKITVNESKFPLKGVQIIDMLDSDMNFVAGSVTISGITPTQVPTLSGNELTVDLGDISGTVEITYKTKVKPEFFEKNQSDTLRNTATLKLTSGPATGITTGANVNIVSNVIEKLGTYNKKNGHITWTIVVNSNEKTLISPTVIDDIKIGQKYVAGSYTVQKSGGAITTIPDNVVYDATGTSTNTGTLTYAFGTDISDKYTIKFETLVLDPEHRTTNSSTTYANSVEIKSATLVGGKQTTNASTPVNSQILTKAGSGYDYKQRYITWTIELNHNEMPLEDVIITDNIIKGLGFVPGSVKINGSPANAADYGFAASDPSDENYAGTFKYTFSGQINTKQVITFQTEVVDLKRFAGQNNGFVVGNSATLTHKDLVDSSTVSETESGSQRIANNIVSKKANYVAGNDFIEWIVDINSNAVDLNSELKVDKFSLIDTLSAGLELDTTSVKLLKYGSVNESGQPQSPVEIPMAKENIIYDATTNKFEFVFPGGTIDKHAYQLSFITDVVSSGSYSNSISLNGEAQLYNANSGSFPVSFNSQGGSAGRQAGKVTVKKVNMNGRSLAGAKFELIDLFGNVVKTGVSDTNGEVVFKGVAFGKDYKIQEVEAPTGYVLEGIVTDATTGDELTVVDHAITVQLSATSYNKSFIFANEEVKANIEFTKQNETGAPLKDAVFGLYPLGETDLSKYIGSTVTSDDQGTVLFQNVPYGQYDIREILAPAGYRTLTGVAHPVNVTAADHGTTKTLTAVPNTLIKAGIKFIKKDDSGIGLSGAEFTLYDSKGNPVGAPVVSKADGTVEFNNVLAGTYTIRETASPSGYIAFDGVIGPVTITETEHGTTLTHITTPTIPEYVTNVLIQTTIEFEKRENKNNQPLAGATFGLFDKAGNKLDEITTIVNGTIADGKVTFTKVGKGEYTVKEIVAPYGYKLNTTEYPISITADDHGKIVPLDRLNPTASVVNTLIEAKVTFVKVSNRTDRTKDELKGAKFSLTPVGITPATQVYEAESDEDGIVLFENVRAGEYDLHEISAPAGFNLLIGKIGSVVITADDHNEIVNPADNQLNPITTVTNNVIKGNVEFEKVDKSNGRPLMNATFALYAADDTTFDYEIATAISNDKGIVRFENVEYGDYTIIEVASPSGYYLSKEELSVSISVEGKTEYLNDFENQLRPVELIEGTIEINKVNKLGDPLAGAKFGLYNVMGTLVAEGVTNSSGIVRFSEVIAGVYTVEELEAPKNYVKSDQVENVTISSDYTYVKLTFVNERSSDAPWPNISVQKVDDAGKPLAGVKFALYKAADTTFTTPVANSITNAKGVATFTNIAPGNYVVKEIEALEGYILSNVTLPITVTEDEETYNAGTVENRVIRGDIVVTKVNERNEPLQGAEFGLYDKDGKIVTVAVSNSNGIAGFKNIPYGSYTLIELTAPQSYEKSDEILAINITIDGKVQAYTIVNKKAGVSGVTPEKPDDSDLGTGSNKPNPDTSETGTGSNQPGINGGTNTGGANVSNQLPKTGDSISTMIWLFVGSGLAIVALLVVGRRRTHKQ